jgi:hypothetical protein
LKSLAIFRRTLRFQFNIALGNPQGGGRAQSLFWAEGANHFLSIRNGKRVCVTEKNQPSVFFGIISHRIFNRNNEKRVLIPGIKQLANSSKKQNCIQVFIKPPKFFALNKMYRNNRPKK